MNDLNKRKFMDEEGIQRAITRISHEILENHGGTEDLVFVGIRTRGVYLAERIQDKVREIENVEIPLGVLDITLYRDDLSEIAIQPDVKETSIPFDLKGKTVILIDDVLFTGRTIRAALNALVDFGRSGKIQLAVLADRGHRELPIRADYVGKNVPTSKSERVDVYLKETDGKDEAFITERPS